MTVGGKNRLCACGCGTPLVEKRADAVWATDACRKRGYGTHSPEIARNRNGGRPRKSGLQLPYRKTVHVLTRELAMFVEPERVEAALVKALPAKQRERLESRA